MLNAKVPRPWEDQVNQALADGVKRYKNAVLVDWHTIAGDHPEFFWDDGIHLRPEGAQFYAQLIAGYLPVRPGARLPIRRRIGLTRTGCSVCQAGEAEMLLLRALRTLVLGIVVGGVAVGACLAAIVPGRRRDRHRAPLHGEDRHEAARPLAEVDVYWSDGT